MHVLILCGRLDLDSEPVKEAIEHSNYYVTSSTKDRKDPKAEAVIVVTGDDGAEEQAWWRRESGAPLFYVYRY